MVALSSKAYLFDPRPEYPLVTTAKRYWDASSPAYNDPDALTLIFAHGTGYHKEQWEPTIEELYNLLGQGALKIKEVWSLDAPNHGDAAIANEKTLQYGYEPIFGWEEYARSIFAFLTGLGTGIDVDFSKRRLVAVGHSMGANALTLALTYGPTLKYEALVLVELMSLSPKFGAKTSETLEKGGMARRDIWASKEEAYQLLKARRAFKVWDDRVLRIFTETGLRDLPTLEYPEGQGVTLKCTKKQETACYRDRLGPFGPLRVIGTFAKRMPVHMLYGEINDYLPQAVKDDVVENDVGGIQNLASFRRIPAAGHLAPQMNPRGVAQGIYEALSQPSNTQGAKL
ncbi:Alpha/beta hydrolase fold-1 [Mycena floridula]|nr:Alpha/beta hydrolase fold-1 [Mycena floridula]